MSDPVAAAGRLAEQLLAPQAERVDMDGVPRSHLSALGTAGLLGLTASCGSDVPVPDVRRVTEILAGACGATWFVSAQHGLPLVTVAATQNAAVRERLLAPMCTGQVLSAVAFTHLRRRDRIPVRATRVPGGWVFDGDVAWASSWGIAEVILLLAESADGQIVYAVLSAAAGPGLQPGPTMHLAAMQATSTVSLHLDQLRVGDEDVVDVQQIGPWLEADRARTANVSPAVFGLLQTVVRRLAQLADRRGDGTASHLAGQLATEAEDLQRRAYSLLDDVAPGDRLGDRLAVRAAALELGVRAATALVVATGGSAISRQAPAQRLLREAAFYLVQAQTPAVREATLRRLGDRW